MSEMKLMLVDDEEDFLAAVERVLSRRGHKIITATNGKEALDKLARTKVDVIVLDVKMPVMDGLTALTRIKELFPQVEVILLTGHGSVDSAVQGIDLGAFDYLMKPYDLDKLVQMAEEAYSRKRVREQAHSD